MEFIDLKAQYRRLKREIDSAIESVLSEAHFIGGEEVRQLEKRLAEYVGRKHCISCGSGTDALQLVFMAYQIGTGDAVFCPDMTFIASIEPAVMLGAVPVFCDIEPDTYNLSPQSLENHIRMVIEEGKVKPRAVVAVDFLGNPANFEEIEKICDKYNLILIEDAAQATGASYKGKKCSSFGDIATTSFFPSKPLGCFGDGGAVYTDNDQIAELIRSLKVHGKGAKGKYDNVRIGMNSRLDTIQAAILLAKLTVLDEEIEMRQKVAKRYYSAFDGRLQTPGITEGGISSYAQFCVLAKNGRQREKIITMMNQENIPSLLYYPNPLHSLKAFAPYPKDNMMNTRHYSECNFGLPFSPYLTEKDQEKVIDTVLNAITISV